MFKRGVIFAAIVCVTLAAGGILLATESLAFWGSGIQAAQPRDSASRSRQSLKPSRQEQVFGEPFDALRNALADNIEILVYGGIAGFGILMMGLAIGNASSSRNKTDAQLELLKQEKEKAENLAKLKSEFLNQVSHELRTPLAVIIGYIECITDGLYGEIEPKHQQILQVVAKQSTHLKNMIDQILIYSRLEAGKHAIHVEDVNLTRVLGDLRETFEFLCRQKGINLAWEMHSESIFVRSDVTRLKEVISNLLQNAVKYTDKGSVTVRTARLSSNSIMVEVEDSGIGISETHLASIFEPFMQVHKTSTENSRGGIGLGLSIVKKHLEQIGGKISVKSDLGKGSIFRIVLPRNFERQKSRASWLFNWSKLHAKRTVYPILTAATAARSQKTADTGRAIG
ncbi:MAG: sensor histidine kinase [Candidatus Binatia bacterium]